LLGRQLALTVTLTVAAAHVAVLFLIVSEVMAISSIHQVMVSQSAAHLRFVGTTPAGNYFSFVRLAILRQWLRQAQWLLACASKAVRFTSRGAVRRTGHRMPEFMTFGGFGFPNYFHDDVD
jgi:hypothetical protein